MAAVDHPPIDHVIVLMLENRSFDHMLGYLGRGQGLTGKEYNLVDPADPHSETVKVNNRSEYVMAVDPAHDFIGVEKELFGALGCVVDPAPMNGFVKMQIEQAKGDVRAGKRIMECFDPAKVPAVTTLAREFCLCDHWFAAVPGPTWLNRFFAHAATSDGMITDTAAHDYDMHTIFDRLEKKGFSWNVYYGDVPQSIMLQHHLNSLDNFRRFEGFHTDVENGELATYTFIEPRYLDFYEWKATDEHPPHDVKLGEYLIAEVYDTLRNSAFWEKSLLLVVWDEHGGFFDHVSPPTGVPNPDGKYSTDPAFDFTRLGVRVSAILVSPFVEKGAVDSTVYEHSSIPAAIRKMFGLPKSLTARDRAANTFEKNLTRSTPRTDTPERLPVPGKPDEAEYHRGLLRTNSLEKWRRGEVDQSQKSQTQLSSFQVALLDLVDKLNTPPVRRSLASLGQAILEFVTRLTRGAAKKEAPAERALIQAEHEAAEHIHEGFAQFLER